MTREEAIKYLSEEQKKTEEVMTLTERDSGVSESVWHTEYEAFNLAISALREQEERSKGCGHCLSEINKDMMLAHGFAHCTDCGRRLEEA